MSNEGRLSALERFKQKGPQMPPPGVSDEAAELADDEVEERAEERKCYSRIRGRRGQLLMIEFRLRNGDCWALEYSYLAGIKFDKSGVLVLKFSGHTVTIEGTRLRLIYAGLLDHAIGYVQEIDEERETALEGEPFVESIVVEERE